MISNWLSIFAGICYFVFGILVIIYKFFIIVLEPAVAYAMGILLMVYGIFRVGRAIYRIREYKNEQSNSDF